MTAPQRRDQLVGVGRQAFAERGFDGVSMEEIAARAGVSKPVVYEHFGSKEGLYQEVVRREMARLEEAITSSIQTGRWRERIEGDPSSVIGIGLPLVRTLLADVGLSVTDFWRH